MRLILTRHYRTQTNEAGRILGWSDSPPGSDWRADIDFVHNRLRETGIGFDAVYSSELERSRQTAIILAERSGIPMVNSVAELNEVDYGELVTLKKDSVAKQYPRHKRDPDLVYPGGESFRQMQQRSVRFLSSLAGSRARQTLLVVAHAGVIRGVVSHFLGLEFADQLRHRIGFRYIGDFRFDGNDCTHYDELGEVSGFVGDGVIRIPYYRPSEAS